MKLKTGKVYYKSLEFRTQYTHKKVNLHRAKSQKYNYMRKKKKIYLRQRKMRIY